MTDPRIDEAALSASEPLDWGRIAAYLRDSLPADALPEADRPREMEVVRFTGGHSNLTYRVRFGASELVLRRPPAGPVAPTAHDMAREFRWLSALNPIFPRAPRPFALCEDLSVAGVVFYVMERRHGMIVRREEPPGVEGKPAVRRAMSEALVDTLAGLHRIGVTGEPLSTLGKPAGFVQRQLRGWTERWRNARTIPVPDLDAVGDWLAANLPGDAAVPSIVHGDFKLDNVMFASGDPGQTVAVFDWEMAALGDPLIDVGILLTYWAPTASPGEREAIVVTDRPGWMTREEILERYAAASGRSVETIRFYEVFAMFKVAVVIQQIYRRYQEGRTDDQRFANFGTRVEFLARRAVAKL